MDVIIPDDLFPYFEICGTRKNYAPGEMIRPEAQNNERLYLVESGRVRVYCSNASGRRARLFGSWARAGLIGEDVFVEFTGANAAVSAVNEVTVVSCSVDRTVPVHRRVGSSSESDSTSSHGHEYLADASSQKNCDSLTAVRKWPATSMKRRE